VSDLDLDQLVHTPEGRLMLEVLQGRRLPLMVCIQDKGEVVFWYPPKILNNLMTDGERLIEWTRLLEEHAARMLDQVPKQ
jgi:hypothetical protein